MRPTRLALALALAMFALPMSVLAQESGATADPAQEAPAEEAPSADAEEEASPNLTWNLALTSDYVFRGVTQTNYKPALQGGLDYAFGDSGWYVGAWASNVDFNDPDGPDLELDVYVGWNHDLTDEWNLDVMLNRYNYLGEDDDFGDGDYNELITALAWNEMITFTLGYTNDVYALDETGWYYGLGGSWEVGNGFTLDAGVGYSTFDDETEIEDYTDWNIGVSRDFGPINIAAGWYDTDSNGEYNFGDTADGRFVLTFSIEG